MLHIPPTASNLPEWIRKAATAINELIRRLGAFGNSVAPAGAYTADDGDYLILIDASAGTVPVSLPANRLGKQLVVKKTDASANVVTITPAPGETIDGAASLDITVQWQTFTLMGIAGGWAVL